MRYARTLAACLAAAVMIQLGCGLFQGLRAQGSDNGSGQPDVAEVTLHVQPGPNGGQLVLTPKGMLVPLPGAGVSGNVVQIYMGSDGGYWYVNRNGQNEDLTQAVNYYRQRMGDGQAQGQMPQATPPQYAPYPQQNITQTTGSSGSGAGTAVASAAAAGLGAMAGAAMTGAYYNNVPYGTPMYYGAGGRPYYNDNGHNVFVNEDGDLNTQNIYAANQYRNNKEAQQRSQTASFMQGQQQARMDQRNQTMSSYQANQASQAAAAAPQGRGQAYAQNHQSYQQQQQWYQNQKRENTQHYQNWQSSGNSVNPFVRDGSGFSNRTAADGEGRGGRFGNRGNSGEGARRGRFGGGGGAAGGFENARSGNRGGGGRGRRGR
ncbi:MAG: hypothetical protein AB7W16_25195 [Candidatus Obscuribacterales bacterium]